MRLRHLLATALGASTLALAACGPTEPVESTKQSNHTTDGSTGNSDTPNNQSSANNNNALGANSENNGYYGCDAYRWDDQAKKEILSQCVGNEGSWHCACDGEDLDYSPGMGTPDSTAMTCEDAVATHCLGLPAAPQDREAIFPCGGAGEDVSVGQCWAALDASGQSIAGSYDCRCPDEDVLTQVNASSCGEAIVSHCAAPCTIDGHQCEVDGYEVYACTCDGETAARSVYGPTCEEAAANACDPARSCEADGDVCRPTDEEGVWECDCTSYYQGTREVYSSNSCDAALRRACEPDNGPCSTWAGYCDQVTTDGFRFDCQCVDGTSMEVTPAQIGNTDDCSMAVVFACGEMDAPEGLECNDEGPNHRLECKAGASEESGVSGYNCTCSEFSADNAVSGGFFVEASTCEEVLEMTSCGD